VADEYRVVWRREGQHRASTRVYQSWSPAHRKAQAVMAIEAAKDDTTFATMPRLAAGPVIEVREVGPWRANPMQPAPPRERLVDDMRARYAPQPADDDPIPF
jgi:hypothetical protein